MENKPKKNDLKKMTKLDDDQNGRQIKQAAVTEHWP